MDRWEDRQENLWTEVYGQRQMLDGWLGIVGGCVRGRGSDMTWEWVGGRGGGGGGGGS